MLQTKSVALPGAVAGTVVLFQFQARIIASPFLCGMRNSSVPSAAIAGALWFNVESIRTFEPMDIDAMRVWPGIGAFGHVKQFLNPAMYSTFKRRLKQGTPTCQSVIYDAKAPGRAMLLRCRFVIS